MHKLLRAAQSYAERRFLPLYYTPYRPRTRRSQLPDYAIVLLDFYRVVNDLNIATRRTMKTYGYTPRSEQTELSL